MTKQKIWLRKEQVLYTKTVQETLFKNYLRIFFSWKYLVLVLFHNTSNMPKLKEQSQLSIIIF